MIQLNDERVWLYIAVDPDATRLLYLKLAPTRNQAITEMVLAEFGKNHLVDDVVVLVKSAPWLQAALHRHGLDYRYETHGNRNTVERIFRESQRRTNQFLTCFSRTDADTVEQ